MKMEDPQECPGGSSHRNPVKRSPTPPRVPDSQRRTEGDHTGPQDDSMSLDIRYVEPETDHQPESPGDSSNRDSCEESPRLARPCDPPHHPQDCTEGHRSPPQEDQPESSGSCPGDVTTDVQEEICVTHQIKEEEIPVDINTDYKANHPFSQSVLLSAAPSTTRSGKIDEYGQIAKAEKQFICTECGKGFSLYSYLTKHQRSHSGEKPYTCTICGKCFAYKPSLVTHQRVHTGEKPFSCNICSKLFVSKFNLKAHEKVHTGEKPVECPACGRCFSNNPALVKHLRIHTGEKPFSCTECGKVFASRSCLNAHQVIHTGERPYMCSECGKAFANQSNLISHRIIHTGEKPYTCPECGKGFANQSNLAKHKLTHIAYKPFVCIDCGNVFSRKDGLAKHFERIHKKKLEF